MDGTGKKSAVFEFSLEYLERVASGLPPIQPTEKATMSSAPPPPEAVQEQQLVLATPVELQLSKSGQVEDQRSASALSKPAVVSGIPRSNTFVKTPRKLPPMRAQVQNKRAIPAPSKPQAELEANKGDQPIPEEDGEQPSLEPADEKEMILDEPPAESEEFVFAKRCLLAIGAGLVLGATCGWQMLIPEFLIVEEKVDIFADF
jgi:hypothetical protein